jgi:hypothetical protein
MMKERCWRYVVTELVMAVIEAIQRWRNRR